MGVSFVQLYFFQSVIFSYVFFRTTHTSLFRNRLNAHFENFKLSDNLLNISNVSNKNCLHLKTNFSPYEYIAKLFFSSDHWCPMTTVKVKHLTHHLSCLIMVTRPNRIRDTSLDFKPQTDLVRGRIFADVFCKKKEGSICQTFSFGKPITNAILVVGAAFPSKPLRKFVSCKCNISFCYFYNL